MGQVTVTLNGRTYRLRCGDGEEQRLLALAEHVRAKLDHLIAQFGQVGDDRLLLMSALLICDELWDASERVNVLLEESRIDATTTQARHAHAAQPPPLPPQKG